MSLRRGASATGSDRAATAFREATEAYRNGDAGNALRRCHDLLESDAPPRAIAAACNLQAVILADRKRLFSAARSMDRGLASAPRDPRLLDHALRLHLALNHLAMAEDLARRACDLAPDSIAKRYRLAQVLRQSGRLQAAEAEASRCLENRPDFTDAWILQAEIAADRADWTGHAESLRRAVATDPDCVTAWAMLAEAGPERTGDLPVAAVLQRIGAEGSDADRRATALFALAGLQVRSHRNAEAFALWQTANRLRAEADPFDVDAWERRTADTASRLGGTKFSARSGPEAPPAGASGLPARPVFIVGMPRSGTSLCEQVLSSHPDICGAGELTAMEYVEAERQALCGAPDEHGTVPGLGLTEARAAYAGCLPPDSGDSACVIDKAPRNFERLGVVFELFPDARVIWMLRHPLDTVLSCFQQDFGPGQGFGNRLDHLARVYLGHARLLRAALRRYGGAIRVVRYADLVQELEATCRELAGFIGVGFHPDMLRPERNPRRVRTASAEQVRQPVNLASLDRWQAFARELAGPRDSLEKAGLLDREGGSRVESFVQVQGVAAGR